MNCKHCQQELDEGVTLCPHCGTENAEAVEASQPQEAEAPKSQKPDAKRLTVSIVACVALLAVLVALIVGGLSTAGVTQETGSSMESTETEPAPVATIPPDGDPDTIRAKGSYTAKDLNVLENMDTVVATMGENTLTNADLQIYYAALTNQVLNSQEAMYMYYYGLVDFSQPLDTLLCYYDESMTWQQYLLDQALSSWQCYQGLALAAEEAGYVLDAEYQEALDALPQTLADEASANGFSSVDAMLAANMGPGATQESYLRFESTYYLGYAYFQHLCQDIDPTAEEIEAYFTENEDLFAEDGITRQTKAVDVRHILLIPQGGTTDADGNTTYSDAEWAACLAEAERIRDEWLAGDRTEERFAALSTQYNQDPGSQANGGLYTDVTEGQTVSTFNNWCMDTTRKTGDYGIVQTSSGYHIMYYVADELLWPMYAESSLRNDLTNQIILDAIDANPMEATYTEMVVYYVPEMG